MSRIDEVFVRLRAEGHAGLVTYVTAGDPDAKRSGLILRALDEAGAAAPVDGLENERPAEVDVDATLDQLPLTSRHCLFISRVNRPAPVGM